jgi:HEXXH motif-containing protein
VSARPHRVSIADFEALARGLDASSEIIRASQLSKRLLVVARVIVAEATARRPDLATLVGLERSVDAIVAARRADRSAVDRILRQPQVGRWAMSCLRQIRNGAIPDANVVDDLAYYGSLAAVVAAEVGVVAELTVRVRVDGGLILPTRGLLRLAPGARWATIRTGPSSRDLLLVDCGHPQRIPATAGDTTAGWQPVRRLISRVDGRQIDVLLDDVDPYRCPTELAAADRLDDRAVADWRTCLDEAWGMLATHHPDQARAVARGVTVLTPLRATGAGDELSATTSDGFGGVVLTAPRDGPGLALALIHEFQHSKLSALLDLVPFFESPPHMLFYAPWRTDPRPLRGLIQGAYAYLGLLGFWDRERQRQLVAPGPAAVAHYEFALWRDGVRIAIEQLQASNQLNAAGLRFVAGMGRRVDELAALDVPPEPRALAAGTAADYRIGWRLRNLAPEPQMLDRWADAWRGGASRPPTPLVETAPTEGRCGVTLTGRAALAKLRLARPERFAALADDHAALAGAASPASAADAALVCGDDRTAARLYRDAIRRSARDLDAWTGLALVRHRTPDAATPALVHHPEVVAGLLVQVVARSTRPPDPDEVAAWVSRAGR